MEAQESQNNKFSCELTCKRQSDNMIHSNLKIISIKSWKLIMNYKNDLLNLPTLIAI